MPDLSATLRYLYGLQARGMKFGLGNTCALLSVLGNPHERLSAVHIAGTNGKGSTASMIASILSAAGYKTGLYTSPHLVRFTERIRIDGEEIDPEDVVQYVRMLRGHADRLHSTFFEVTTALAFRYFADNNTDIAVVETGLGGKLDATNVLRPLLSVITSLALDHTDLLGTSLKSIAREKGGIMKRGVPCFVGNVGTAEAVVLRRIAAGKRTTVSFADSAGGTTVSAEALNGQVVNVQGRDLSLQNVFCSLPGDYQGNNIGLAVLAAEYLRDRGFPRVNDRAIRNGLSHVRHFSGFRARLELVQRKPVLIADVAHNPDAIRALGVSLRRLWHGGIVAVFGAMKDKDVGAMALMLGRIARLTAAVAPGLERAMEPRAIVELFHRTGKKCIIGGSVAEGVKLALKEVRGGDAIVVTGSHYVVGEFLREMEGAGT